MPAEPPTGELSDDGKTKTFKVTAQVTGPATEIPAIAFSYFDPAKGAYQTIHSEPIALSVKGGSVVGAGDVVAARPAKRAAAAPAPRDDDARSSTPSSRCRASGAVDDRPLGGALLWLLVGAALRDPARAARRPQLAAPHARPARGGRRGARRAHAASRSCSIAARPRRRARSPARSPRRCASSRAHASDREPADDGGLLAQARDRELRARAPRRAPLSRGPALRRRGPAAPLARRGARAPAARSARPRPRALLARRSRAAPRRRPTRAPTRSSDGRAALPAGDGADHRCDRAQGRVRARRDRARRGRARASRIGPSSSPTGATPRSAPATSRPPPSPTAARSRSTAATPRARHNLAWLRSRQADAFRPASRRRDRHAAVLPRVAARAPLLVGAAAFALAILLLVPWAGRRRRGARRRSRCCRSPSGSR